MTDIRWKASGLALACTLVAIVFARLLHAAEVQRYSGQNCIVGGLDGEYNDAGFHSDFAQDIFCPIIKLSGTSAFSDIDLYTSSGVLQSEAVLKEMARDGDFVASYGPTTTSEGGGKHHDWPAITPFSQEDVLMIQVAGAVGDEIYSYSFTDTGVTY